MTKKHLYKYFLPVGVLLAFASMASATVVAPGGTVSPATTLAFGGTVDATTSGTLNTGAGLIGTYTETVYSDPGNTLCTGCLDFVIQVANSSTSTDVIDTVSASNFGGFTTSVGYSAPNITDIAPGSIDRTSGTGNDINFLFTTNDIAAGKTSDYLVIQTNAKSWGLGTVSIQDGSSAFGTGFSPTPEPNMACLMSVLGLGLVGIAYRRKKNVAKNTEV